jgi:hypothetical protein
MEGRPGNDSPPAIADKLTTPFANAAAAASIPLKFGIGGISDISPPSIDPILGNVGILIIPPISIMSVTIATNPGIMLMAILMA